MDNTKNTIYFHQRIIVRLLVPLCLIAFILFAVITSFVVYTYDADQRALRELPQEVSQKMHDKVDNFFALQNNTMLFVAKDIRTSSLSEDQSRYIADIVDANSAILEMLVTDPAHNETFRAIKPTVSSIAALNNPVIRKSLDRVLLTRRSDITKPLQTQNKTPYVVWSTPIFSSTNQVVAILSATIDISVLWQLAVEVAPQDFDTHVYITDSEGHILVSNKEVDAASAVSTVTDILFRTTTSKTATQYTGVLKSQVSGKTTVLPPTDWYAVVEISLADLTKNSRKDFIILLSVALFLGLLLVYTMYVFHKNLVQPLSIFQKAVASLSEGNYATRVFIPVRNELALLAVVINKMAASIESQTTENVTRLKKTIADLDRSAKTLMRRDEELSKANERLMTLDHAKSEFVSIAAHQLRTPLSALKWAQQMLLDGEAGQVSEPQKLLLSQSQESVRRMVVLVNDLLAADHLEYGTVTYNFLASCPEDILQNMAAELKPMADEHHISVVCDFQGKRSSIQADVERLKEAFLNIINNAIKYSPDGGKVVIASTYGMGKVSFSITDSGIGIPLADRERLFEKFVRMENAKKVDANGSGLGLFIAKKIVDAHGGTIWFTSTEGAGTTFYIDLPTRE